ncbi:hypothetical protein M433DRAFT_141899 [Acidomyces richmondensis BFW]|nr:MAG: hypothetical protein FE78DRAFT_76867 [Acidomyces sp. 'richmondensis']KYG47574.1 hypothetical protein M433DRAFT_141899 [Acidomyces richmondensis BFW]
MHSPVDLNGCRLLKASNMRNIINLGCKADERRIEGFHKEHPTNSHAPPHAFPSAFWNLNFMLPTSAVAVMKAAIGRKRRPKSAVIEFYGYR